MHLHTASHTDDKIIAWIFVGSVVFFLFAASVIPSSDHTTHRNGRRLPNKTYGSEKSNTFASLRQDEIMRQMIFDEIYRTTFLRLKDEHKTFLEADEAKTILPGFPGAIRKPLCGGWESKVPSLVVRFYGDRCPPMELI